MLKFLSKVMIEFNALDSRTAACVEFLAQCNACKVKESNSACQLLVDRRTDDHPAQITVTFVNGAEEVLDAAATTTAQTIRSKIHEKGRLLENEQMFRDAAKESRRREAVTVSQLLGILLRIILTTLNVRRFNPLR